MADFEKSPPPLLKSRALEIKGYLDKTTFDIFSSQLRSLNAQNREEIVVYFNSVGGDVQASLLLYECINNSSASVVGIIEGECSSSAVIPFLACAKRYMSQFSYIQIHVIEIREKLSRITPEYLERKWGIQKTLNNIILKKTSFPENKLSGIISSGDDYRLYPGSCKEYGFIQSIL